MLIVLADQMALHSAESITNRNVSQWQGAPQRRREYINRDLQIQRDRLDFRLGRELRAPSSWNIPCITSFFTMRQ